MGLQFKYEIPIKPHLKRFLGRELGLDFFNGDEWVIGYKSVYGKYALRLLDTSHLKRLSQKALKTEETLTLSIPKYYHFGKVVDNVENPQIWSNFSIFLEDLMNYYFFTYVDAHIIEYNLIKDLASGLLIEFCDAEDILSQQRMSKVFASTLVHKTRKDAIREFMNNFGISEGEMSFESLERRHKRYLKKKDRKLTFKPDKVRGFPSYATLVHYRYEK